MRITHIFLIFTIFLFFPLVSAGCRGYEWSIPNNAAASSVESASYSVNKAIDNDARTHWKSKEEGLPQWISFDLEKKRCVKGIETYIFSNYGPINATIQSSDDGEKWRKILDISMPGGERKQFNFREIPARYIRIYETSGNRTFGTLSEIKIQNASLDGQSVFVVPGSISGKTHNAPPVEISAEKVTRGKDPKRELVRNSKRKAKSK
ncbi:MAG: discoidin domain-containing protein [Nanoarchaeota archaeon]